MCRCFAVRLLLTVCLFVLGDQATHHYRPRATPHNGYHADLDVDQARGPGSPRERYTQLQSCGRADGVVPEYESPKGRAGHHGLRESDSALPPHLPVEFPVCASNSLRTFKAPCYSRWSVQFELDTAKGLLVGYSTQLPTFEALHTYIPEKGRESGIYQKLVR